MRCDDEVKDNDEDEGEYEAADEDKTECER